MKQLLLFLLNAIISTQGMAAGLRCDQLFNNSTTDQRAQYYAPEIKIEILRGSKINQKKFGLKRAEEAVDLAIKNYESRRGWSQSFSEKLKALIAPTFAESIYYNVIDTTKPNKPIIGSLRTISAPYALIKSSKTGDHYLSVEGLTEFVSSNMNLDLVTLSKKHPAPQLPMEKILNTQLARANAPFKWVIELNDSNEKLSFALGSVIEPGNFVVDQNHPRRDAVLLEIHKHFAISHFTESSIVAGTSVALDMNAPTYYTYGDAISVRMYKKLGFKVIGSADGNELSHVMSASGMDLYNSFEIMPAKLGFDADLREKTSAGFKEAISKKSRFFTWTLEDFHNQWKTKKTVNLKP